MLFHHADVLPRLYVKLAAGATLVVKLVKSNVAAPPMFTFPIKLTFPLKTAFCPNIVPPAEIFPTTMLPPIYKFDPMFKPG